MTMCQFVQYAYNDPKWGRLVVLLKTGVCPPVYGKWDAICAAEKCLNQVVSSLKNNPKITVEEASRLVSGGLEGLNVPADQIVYVWAIPDKTRLRPTLAQV